MHMQDGVSWHSSVVPSIMQPVGCCLIYDMCKLFTINVVLLKVNGVGIMVT
jgi:hypothetical protein